MALGRLSTLAESFDNADVATVLRYLRATIGAIRYLDRRTTPNVNQRLTDTVNNIREQLLHAQTQYNAAFPNDQVAVADYWSEWVQDYYEVTARRARTFVIRGIDELMLWWGVRTGEAARQLVEILTIFQSELAGLTIDTSRMH